MKSALLQEPRMLIEGRVVEEWLVPCHTKLVQPPPVWEGYQSKNTEPNTLYQHLFFLAHAPCPVRLCSCVLLIRGFPTHENPCWASHYASSYLQIVMIDTTTQQSNGHLITTNPSCKTLLLEIGQSPPLSILGEEEYTQISSYLHT